MKQWRGTQRYLPLRRTDEDELTQAILALAAKYGRYGYRRTTAELRRQGMLVNHKRVARIMRDDNLIAVTREWRRGRRGHMEVEVNLAGRMKVTGINQLWVADITYVRLNWEFVYLAVVLDRFSRRVVGWALDRSLRRAG